MKQCAMRRFSTTEQPLIRSKWKDVPRPVLLRNQTKGKSPLVQELRKANPPKAKSPLYYAVRVGRSVGVFEGWDVTARKVLGYPRAHYKSFRSEKQAHKWLVSDDWATDSRASDLDQGSAMKPEVYHLNFSALECRKPESERFGDYGCGWILRRKPESTLVLAGCDLYSVRDMKEKYKDAIGFNPVMNPLLPFLHALNQAFGEIKEYVSADGGDPTTKLPFPLVVKCNSPHLIGLLNGNEPDIPEVVEPLQMARNSLLELAADFRCEQIPHMNNQVADIIAKAGYVRKNPRTVIKGKKDARGHMHSSRIIHLLKDTPDVSREIKPVFQPHSKKPPKEEKNAKKEAAIQQLYEFSPVY